MKPSYTINIPTLSADWHEREKSLTEDELKLVFKNEFSEQAKLDKILAGINSRLAELSHPDTEELNKEKSLLVQQKSELKEKIEKLDNQLRNNHLGFQLAKFKEKATATIDIDAEIKNIFAIIKSEYPATDPSKLSNEANEKPLRLQFFMEKLAYLEARKINYEAHLAKAARTEDLDELFPDKNIGTQNEHSGGIFNVGKKLIDLLDDAWSAVKDAVPGKITDFIGPILTGVAGFIIHIGEGYEGLKEAYHAIKTEDIGQRKTRIASNALIFMLGGAGAGLSLAFLASAIGATVTAATIAWAPILVPGFLTAIYGLSLWRRSYTLDKTIAQETEAKNDLEDFKANHKGIENIETDILNNRKELNKYSYTEITKAKSKEPNTHTEREKHIDSLLQNEKYFINLQSQYDAKSKLHEHLFHKRLEAEREVAFTAVEVAASTVVLVGSVLGTVALLGAASVASFGIIPLILLAAGVAVGVGAKVFERVNEKNEFSYTNRMRNWFNKLFSPSNKKGKSADFQVNNSPLPHVSNVDAYKGLAHDSHQPAMVVAQKDQVAIAHINDKEASANSERGLQAKQDEHDHHVLNQNSAPSASDQSPKLKK